MNLTSKSAIRNLFKNYGIRPSKKLGQNFLIDGKTIKKIIKAAESGQKEYVLEIGPGLGVLTQELAKRVKKVVTVEKDPRLAWILNNELRIAQIKNVKIVQGDILKISNSQFLIFKYKVVANLPFYLTSPVIRKFLESDNPPGEMVLVVQKEVAQRIAAQPPDMNLLAVSVQFYAKPEIEGYVSKKSFWPQPKVDSAIIKIVPRKSACSIRVNPLLFFKIVKAGFSQPRKQLINNLSKELGMDKTKVNKWLLKNDIQPTQRAETLTLQDWIKLTKSFKPR